MALTSQGLTFTFPGFSAHYTSISVEEPQAEVVDMTSFDGPIKKRRMVETGDVTQPGRIRVDYMRLAGTAAPLTVTGLRGQLVIAHQNISVSKQAILQTASSEMAVGDIVRGTVEFVIDESL
jgi:hypothetical protein